MQVDNKILAVRYKSYYKIPLILGLLCVVVGILSKSVVLIVLFALFSLVILLLYFQPTNAIYSDDDKFVINGLFKNTVLPVKSVKWVSIPERRRNYYSRHAVIEFALREKHDVSTLTVVYEKDGTEKRLYVYDVENSSATEVSINLLLKNLNSTQTVCK